MRRTFLLLTILLPGILCAQTGPGGVGSSSSNIVWLRASDIAGTDGAQISGWADQSGNSNDFTTNGSNEPIFIADELNGLPVIRFGGHNNDRVYLRNMPDWPTSSITTFVIQKTIDTGDATLSYAVSDGSDNEFFQTNSENLTFSIDGSTTSTDAGFNDNNWHLNVLTWRNVGGAFSYHQDGTMEDIGFVNSGTTMQTMGTLVIGAEQDSENGGFDNTQDYDGDIAEVIIFNRNLGNAERIIIENYLSSRYGISISSDRYAFDGSYGHDVAGIGMAFGGSNTSARSAGLLQISGASNFDNNEYLFFGHDDGATTFSTTEVPSDVAGMQRIAREWIFDETGNVGTVTVTIDAATIGLSGGYTDYYLLVDDNGDFSSGATSYLLTNTSGTEYEATSVDVGEGSYMTIAAVQPIIQFTALNSYELESNTSPSVEVSVNFALSNDLTVSFAANGSSTAVGGGTDYSFSLASPLTISAGSTTADITITVNDDGTPETDETIVIDLSAPSVGVIGDQAQHTLTLQDDDEAVTVAFTSTTASGGESSSPASFPLTLSAAQGTDVTVEYTATGGSATGGGVDYFNSSGTATITAGNVSGSFDIDINADLLDEPSETIIVTLLNPSVGVNLGANRTFTYTINDDDGPPEVQFATTTGSYTESVAQPAIQVNLSAVSGQDVTVNYSATGVTATENIDFSLADGTLTIPAGSTSGFIGPLLYDDDGIEGSETFTMAIATPTNATLGANTSFEVTIADNDFSSIGFVGPGGVGNASSNIVWLESENIAGTDGAQISGWPDNSGNDNDFSTNGSNEPVFIANEVNGQPAIRFGGHNNDRVYLRNMPDFPESELTTFLVFKTVDTDDALISYAASTGSDNEFFVVGSDDPNVRMTGANAGNQGVAFNDNDWHIQMLSWTTSGGNLQLFKDGALENTDVVANNQTNERDGTLVLGAEQDSENGGYDASQDFDGDMAEFILFDRVINAAQREIVHNYLSAKYGITIANDFYAFDNTHGADLIGIGQSGTDQHLTASDNTFKIGSAASIDADGDFVFVGHDGGDVSAWTTTDAPDGGVNIQRIEREWRIDNSGFPGSITISIDAGSLPTLPAEHTKYYLLVDGDGAFGANADLYAMDEVSAGEYSATNLTLTDGDFITVAVVRPAIEFAVASSQIFESGGPASVEVSLNFASDEDLTIDYAVNGSSTAVSGNDYVLSDGTLTIPAGSTTASLSITLTDDTTPETDETLILDLSNPSSAAQLGSVLQHTLTINDTDVPNKIQFAATSSSGSESLTPISFTIQVDNPDASDMTVDYAVTAGTAIGGGVDYFNASGTATITGNGSDTQTTISIDINEDLTDEVDETFTITLSNPSNNVNLGSNVSHVYTINDNDAAPTIAFSSATGSGSENTSPGSIAVALSSISGQDVTVDYTATGVAATEGTDFLLDDGTLTITAGNTIGFIQPVIYDDSDVEGAEDFTVTISSPAGATLGATTTHTFSIGDNDAGGIGSTGPGGVGNASSNIVWLESENIAGTDGAQISGWPDNSGNDNDFATNGSNEPIYVQDEVNGQPVVRFGGHNNDRVYLRNMPDFPTDAISTILVYKTLDSDDAHISYAASTGSDNEFLIQRSEDIRPLLGGNSAGSQGITFNDDAWHIQTVTWETSGGDFNIYKDGALGNNDNVLVNQTLEPDGTLVLGAEQDSENGGYQSANDFDGDMAEFILFDRVLNTAQRTVIENYLAAKFDIAIANDYYAFNNGYGEDVIGIGQDGGDTHESASDRIISINSAAGIDADGEFIFIGHDGRDITAWTTDELEGSDIYRLEREWRYDETGTVGVFSLKVDSTAIPDLPSSEYTLFYLLSDADGDFTSGSSATRLNAVGDNEFEAAGIDLNDGDHFTIAVVRPSVAFELANSAIFESGGPATINVQLNYALDSEVTVDYAINGSSTATGGSDYVLSAGTITIPAGLTSMALSVTLTDDTAPEGDETLVIDLSNPNNAELGVTSQHTVTIHDTDITNKIQFQSTASSGDESVTPVSITVEVGSADVTDMTVDWTITGGTATGSGIDYISTSGTATITGNGLDTQTTFDIDLNEDLLDEVDETIIITLSNPSSNVNLGTNLEYTYTILDNDTEPTVQFLSTTSSSNEGSSPANIEVSLSGISGQDVTVDYTISGGTATNGNVDYNLIDGTLTIPPGDAQAFIKPTIVDDDVVEGSETFTITISSPNAATLGANTTNTLTIIDNDNNGISGPGGVGDETTNILWLKADAITGIADGTDIDGWVDMSGNSNDMTDNNSNVPAFEENEINGLPAVRFGDNNNDRVFLRNMQDFPSNAITTVTVLRTSEDDGTTLSYATDGQNNSYFQDRQQNGRFAIDGGITTPNVAFNDGSWHIDVHTWTSDGGDYAVRKDGLEMATGTVRNGGSIDAGGTLAIGAEQDSPNGGYDRDQDFDGELAEVIIYNYDLNDAQLTIVENYLAAKYNGEFAIANSYFTFGSNYGHDLVGIGQLNGDQHLAAQSDDMFTIGTASGLDTDGDFLFIGHNDDDMTTWSSTEAPNAGSNFRRMAREWIMDESGDISDFTATIDLAGFPAPPAGFDTYYLLVDADGDFSSTSTFYLLNNIGGTEYEAGNVSVVDGGFMTIGVALTEIQFNTTSSQEFEPNGPATVQVDLDFVVNVDITVDYTVTGTATGGGVDYTLADGTLTITSGNSSGLINIPLTNDVVLENSETIILTLSNPSSGVNLGANTVHTFSILDDDNTRRIGFDATASSGNESVSPVTLTIELTSTDASDPIDVVNPTTADYLVTGTATGGGEDYVLAAGTATVPAGDGSTTVDIPISQDALDEVDETIIVTLTNPINSNLATSMNEYTYTILDDDDPPTISFASALTSGSEGSSPANIEVQLSSVSGQDVTVDYAVADGTAVNGNVDYNIADGTLTISAGATSGFIQPVIVDDGETESGEDFTVTLTNAVGADLTSQITVTTFTIADNDNDGITGPGGVGESGNIMIWLKADNITGITSGNDITAGWPDASGGNRDMTVDGGNRPNWVDNEINGYPVVRFGDSNNDRVELNNTNFFPSTAITTITLLKTNEDDGTTLSYATSSEDNSYFQDRQQSGRFSIDGNIHDPNPDVVFNDNQWHIDVHTWRTSDGEWEIYKDGTLEGSGTHEMGTTIGTGGTLVIGAEQDNQGGGYDNNQDFDGDLAEVVIYNMVLNDAQRIIVENYLAAKYRGEFTIANDRYGFETTHSYDVAGIGRASADNEHPAANSASILTVSNPSGLDGTNEYLIFGHDNGAVNSWTTVDAPNSGTNIQRIEREWIFDRTNDVGTVSITVDTSLFAARPSNFNDFVVMVDADGDFANDAAVHVLSPWSGPEFSADNLDIPDGSYVSFGVLRRTAEFSASASNIFEPNGPASIEVSLSFAAADTETVDYAVTAGSATGSGTDYTLSAGTLVFNPGNITQDIFVTLINDSDIESDETVAITLSNPSSGISLGSVLTHTLTINDDDSPRRVEVVGASTTGDEATSPITITFQLESAAQIDAVNATSVDYTVTGTATGGGTDYTLADGTATIAAGFENITRGLVVVDDALAEAGETVTITISNPVNANLSPTLNTFTYTITDNDTAPTVSFTSASSTGSEASSPGSIEVTLSSAAGQDVGVDYTVADGTATGGAVDHNLIAGTVVISAGSTTGYIQPVIIDDSDVEPGENFTVTLTGATGATVTAPTTHTFTILDNDTDGITGPGGVGDQGILVAWLDAEDITGLGDGTTINTWEDASGNANDFVRGGNPSYETNEVNGRPVIRFNGNSERLVKTNMSDFPSTAITTIAVFNTTEDDGTTFSYASSADDDDWRQDRQQNGRFTVAGGNETPNVVFNDGNWNIDIRTWQSSDGAYTVYKNGTAAASGTHATGDYFTSGGTLAIGAEQDGINGNWQNARDFDGDIAEVAVYNKVLNSAQRILIENYLSSKYGISISNDKFSSDATHGYDVAGVGQEDIANFHSGATAGIISVTNPLALSDGDYMLYGHDNAGFADWTSSANVPNIATQRIPQEWVFEETGDIGTFTLTVDIASLPATSTGFDSYALVLDGDGDFTSGASYVPLSNISGTLYSASGIDVSGTTYVTIVSIEYVTIVSGDFNHPANWFAGVTPGSGQTAVIADGDAMNLTADMTLGSLVIGTGASLDLNGHTLTLDDGCISGAGTFDATDAGSVVRYAATSTQCVTSGTYGDIQFTGSGSKSLSGPIVVSGDLDISNAAITLDVTLANYQIDVTGNWSNSGTFNQHSGTVRFIGSTDQTISSSATEVFHDLVVNKPAGDIILSREIQIDNSLTLIAGDLVLGSHDLTLSSGVTISGGGATSYIQADNSGLINRVVPATGSYTFPVGDDDEYSPFTFTLNSATLASAQVFLNLRDIIHPQVTDVAISRYWTLTQTGISGAIDYDVSFTYTDDDIMRADEADFEGAKFTSGATLVTGSTNDATNTVTMTGLGAFSDYTATGSGSPLPIELLTFEARVDDETVIVSWSTASEHNNDYFTIERTYDWEHFEEIGMVDGAGDSEEILHYQFVDEAPIPGVSYYRLKQTDFDGQFTYSNLVMVEYDYNSPTEAEIAVFPNPATINQGCKVQVTGLVPGTTVKVKVVAMDGRETHSMAGAANGSGTFEQELHFPTWAVGGTYVVYVIHDGQRHFERLIIR